MKRVRDRVQLVRNETKAEAPEMEAAQSLAPPELAITSGMEDDGGMQSAAAVAAPAPAPTPAKPARKRIEGMPEALQEHLEATFGQDFSEIKVHANSSQASKAGALAFARGKEVHFAPGQFQPDTPQGRQLIGHEFAHLVQQSTQHVKANTAVGDLPVNDDPALEAAADAMGARFAKMEPAQAGGSVLSPLAAEAGVVQLKAESAPATATESPVEEAPAADTPAQDNATHEGGVAGDPATEQAAKEDGAPDQAQDEKSEDQAPEEEKEGKNPELDTLLAEQDGQMEGMESGAEQEGEESAEAAEGEAAQLAPDPNGGGKGLLDWGNLTYILAPTITLPGLAIEKLSKAASAGLEKTSAPDWLKNGVKNAGNIQGSINEAIHQYGGELFEGAVLGDFKEDPTAMNLVGQVLMGLVPYAGQAADLRDTVHAIGKMTNGGWKEGGNWLNLGLTLLAWVPLLGDGVKVLSKLGKLKGVKNLLKKLEPFSKAISEGWGKVTKYFAPKIDAFKKTLSKGWNDLKTAATKKFNAAKDKVIATVGKVKSGLSSAWNWVKGKASAGMDWIKGKAAAGWDKAKSLIAKGTKKLSDGIAKAAKVVQQKAAALPQKLLNKTKAIWEGVKSGAKSIKDKVKSSINGLKNKFERFVGGVRKSWNDWRGKGKDQGAEGKPKDKDQPEKKSPEGDKKAVELPAAIAAAKSIAATNERAGTPAQALIAILKSALMPRFKWIKDFVATLLPKGQHKIEMIASRHDIDGNYDPKEENNDLHFEDFERARNEALEWLEKRGFKAEQPTLGKFGAHKGLPVGMKTNTGNIGFRIEFDERSGAHINVFAGKEKGPHFIFNATEKTVIQILKRFR